MKLAKTRWRELLGVPLLPLAGVTAGAFGAVGGGRKHILASRRQQNLIPQLRQRFVHLKAARRLKRFFDRDDFLQVATS